MLIMCVLPADTVNQSGVDKKIRFFEEFKVSTINEQCCGILSQ